MPIVQMAGRQGKLIIRTTANESYIVAGNTSVSNLMTATEAADTSNAANGFTVLSAHVTKLCWSTNGMIQILRGSANQFVLFGTGEWNLERDGLAYSSNVGSSSNADNATANLAINITSAGTLMLEMKRTSNGWVTDY